MEIIIYVIRCIIIMLVAWLGIRLIGKKSIAEMTSYDLAAVMVLTTVAAEPLVFKVPSKVTIGVFTITIFTFFVGKLSLAKFFYDLDSKPTVVVAEGKVLEKELKTARMNLPLLLSELRIKGYQNLSDIKFAIIEPSGKLAVIPRSQTSPVTPKTMGIPSAPVHLSIPLILDGKVIQNNLDFLQKDQQWLTNQLRAFNVEDFNEVLVAQYGSTGELFVNVRDKHVDLPDIL